MCVLGPGTSSLSLRTSVFIFLILPQGYVFFLFLEREETLIGVEKH